MLKCLAERAEQILDDSSPDKPSSTTPSKSTSSTMISVTLQLKKRGPSSIVKYPPVMKPCNEKSPRGPSPRERWTIFPSYFHLCFWGIKTRHRLISGWHQSGLSLEKPKELIMRKMMIHQWIEDGSLIFRENVLGI